VRAKSRAVLGSDSRGAQQQVVLASEARESFENHVRDGQCDAALKDWKRVRAARKDEVEWVYEHMWHQEYAGRIKVGARSTIRKWVEYKEYDVHNRRITDVTAEDVYLSGMQDEEVKGWCNQYPEAAANMSADGLKRNICWCYEEVKDGDSQCVCPDCWSTKGLFFETYKRARKVWHSDCEGTSCGCQTNNHFFDNCTSSTPVSLHVARPSTRRCRARCSGTGTACLVRAQKTASTSGSSASRAMLWRTAAT
jgi:hypothetical protein